MSNDSKILNKLNSLDKKQAEELLKQVLTTNEETEIDKKELENL